MFCLGRISWLVLFSLFGEIYKILLWLRESNSVQFSRSVMYDSLWPHGLQHARLPCPSPTPEACSNSCTSSWWRHPTMSSSVIPFSSYLQSFLASGSFLMSQLFILGGQSIGVSASASVLPMNIQGWLVWSPCSPVDSQGSSSATQFESINSSTLCFLYGPTLTYIHDYWENHNFVYVVLCWQIDVSALQYSV